MSNAWHHRSDAMSSVVAVVGIIGSLCGFDLLDPIAGCVVCAMLLTTGIEIGMGGIRPLVDFVEEDQIAAVERCLKTLTLPTGVHACSDVRARHLGGGLHVDVCIRCDGTLPTADAVRASNSIRRHLIAHCEQLIAEVVVQVEEWSPVDTVLISGKDSRVYSNSSPTHRCAPGSTNKVKGSSA